MGLDGEFEGRELQMIEEEMDDLLCMVDCNRICFSLR